MKKVNHLCGVFLAVMVLCIACTCSGCTGMRNEDTRGDTLSVVTTIMPLSEFVKRTGGDRISCRVMLPPGSSPHTFEMTPGQMRLIADADLYVMVGSGLEFENHWMARLLEINPDIRVINASERLDFITRDGDDKTDHDHRGEAFEHAGSGTGQDPHVWLSLRNAAEMVQTISSGLADLDPGNTSFYEENRERYTDELQSLDELFVKRIRSDSITALMVTHPSFGYFCRDYGIRQIAIEQDGKEPTPAVLTDLIQSARIRNLSYIIAEPQYSVAGAGAIAEETGVSIVFVDPLPGEFLASMRHLADVL
ncbi:MAG: zinc ABC transporter substrate-binding protein [Methanospirillaceae archaeon]|nr:zinc ABC transporter substrate-binding protein [Methanospirillaceae archaeon]